MSLIGTRLGAYEVTAQIGAGGMGEVYRARDTRLDREVAIKVLPEALASDSERLARFEREAKTLAALNHPNIAHIHGVEDALGTPALVMELVEGPTLADRIARGPIPLDEALPIAKQVAEGLEAAHELGIIHRDLKPANIKVRDDGTVKILDFGLAKALDPKQPTSINATQSPTITTPAMMTGVGIILGTAAYMSPEQAKGRPADRRSDVWAFGCVLYEMLTGARAFGGADVSDTIADVLRREPDWSLLEGRAPRIVCRLLRRCLTKEPRQRLASVADARLDLDESSTPDSVETPAPIVPYRSWFFAFVGAALCLAGLVVGFLLAPRPSPASEVRLEITTPPTDDPFSMAVSPDGNELVFAGTVDGVSQLWRRRLDTGISGPISGTEGARYPFYSADGRSLAFFANLSLKRMRPDGSTIETVTTVSPFPRGGSWARDGTILFVPTTGAPIFRLSLSAGSTPRQAAVFGPGESAHYFPQFLPDGQHFVYFVRSTPEKGGIYLGSLSGAESKRLFFSDTAAVFAAPDSLLFAQQNRLMAQRLVPSTWQPDGEPLTVAKFASLNSMLPFFLPAAASNTRTIAYRPDVNVAERLAELDRAGNPRPSPTPSLEASSTPAWSPDGSRFAATRTVDGNGDIWIYDSKRGASTRLTTNPATDSYPVWAPDGTRVAFASNRTGVFDIYVTSLAHPESDQVVWRSPQPKLPTDWSGDGRWLLCLLARPAESGAELWAVPMTGGTPIQVTRNAANATFSPDGRWIAYASREATRMEVVVQSFPGAAEKIPISTAGGDFPRWRRDGRELYYFAPDGRLIAVPVSGTPTTLAVGTPTELFRVRVPNDLIGRPFDVSADGQRFLAFIVQDPKPSTINVILNWSPRELP
jgi:serine/threonine protein kinase